MQTGMEAGAEAAVRSVAFFCTWRGERIGYYLVDYGYGLDTLHRAFLAGLSGCGLKAGARVG